MLGRLVVLLIPFAFVSNPAAASLLQYSFLAESMYSVDRSEGTDHWVSASFVIDTETHRMNNWEVSSTFFDNGTVIADDVELHYDPSSGEDPVLVDWCCVSVDNGDQQLSFISHLGESFAHMRESYGISLDEIPNRMDHIAGNELNIRLYEDDNTYSEYHSAGWGYSKPKAVPEPTTLGLLASGLALIGLRRRIL